MSAVFLREREQSPHADSRAFTSVQQPIRVLLADDHPVTLWGLQQLVDSANPRMVVCGMANSRDELLAHPALPVTDVVLLDINLGAADGLQCLPRLVEELGVKVVVLTGDTNPRQHRDAVMRGARGVVLKSHPTDDVLQAIECVYRGEAWIGRALMSELLSGLPGSAASRAPEAQTARNGADSLTPKELQVIRAIVAHRGAKSIVVAEALTMSEHTLRNHLTVIYSKLRVQGKLDLYVYAVENGLATAPAGSVLRAQQSAR